MFHRTSTKLPAPTPVAPPPGLGDTGRQRAGEDVLHDHAHRSGDAERRPAWVRRLDSQMIVAPDVPWANRVDRPIR